MRRLTFRLLIIFLMTIINVYPSLSSSKTPSNFFVNYPDKFESSSRIEKATLIKNQEIDYHSQIDILHYKIEIDVYPLQKQISGRTTLNIRSLDDNLSTFKLDFEGLSIESVNLDGFDVVYSYDNRYITVEPDFIINKDTEFEVVISYNGKPTRGFYFSNNSIYTHNEPKHWDDLSWARYWYPCNAVPWDKATSETIIKVPDNLIVASNGLLVEVIDLEETKESIYHWREDYPIATYLVSLAISEYYTFSDYYNEMELTYFVYPYMAQFVPYEFSDLPDMISFYSRKIHPYPFEKYGMAVADMSGAMENQTITSLGSYIVTGNKFYNWLYAHELAHQWWGDMVTLTDWREIWLNEGFATYFDSLYTEYALGDAPFKARLNEFKDAYFGSLDWENFPIYAPDYMWGNTVYKKGAVVLHMLRDLVGDEDFWKIIQKYARDFAYSNSTIGDFIQICEEAYGEDLGWFFDEWIYQKGYPEYNVSWFSKAVDDNHFTVEVTLQQIQMIPRKFPLYKMPFKFEFIMPERLGSDNGIYSNSIFIEKMVEDEFEKFSFLLDFDPIKFNPDSDKVSLRKIYHLPDYVPPRYGTIGLAFERVENILLVNESFGNEQREVTTFTGFPFKLEIVNPSYLDPGVKFVIYAVFDECSNTDNFAVLPFNMGTFCFSIPPTTGNPYVIANNIGFEDILGKPIFDSEPAPSTIIDAPFGFGQPLTITLQGLVLDEKAISGISITNAIVLKVYQINR
ncbi:M1 family metallopeptidase [bacterium]|nr:M1 family metallopeptidase [bacterium]